MTPTGADPSMVSCLSTMRLVQAQDTTLIEAETSAVWAAVTDFSAYPDWWPSKVRIAVLETTPKLIGSAFEVIPYRGRGFRCVVDRVMEGEELGLAYSGLYRGSGVWKVEEAGGQTARVTYTVDLEIADRLTSLLSYVLPVARIHSRLMRDVFDGLADRLGARVPGGGTPAPSA